MGAYLREAVWTREVWFRVFQGQVYGFQWFREGFAAGWAREVLDCGCDFFFLGDDASLVEYDGKPCL